MDFIKLILIFINYFHLIKSSHASFKNDCGPFNGLESSILMPKKSNCIDPDNNCCYVEGEKNLIKRTACVTITGGSGGSGGSEARIKYIQDLSEIATKINVDCGQPKEFVSDCGINPNKNKDDCFADKSNGKCCFIKINSPQFEGQGCRKFKSISLNDIGEAVVAAKTVDADLEVECKSNFLNKIFGNLIAIIFLFFL